MANKKKKVGPSKSQLKQQKLLADSQLVNDSTILALVAPSRTVHATVPQNSNSNQSPPVVLAPENPYPNHQIHSPVHSYVPLYHVDPSPSINHVFMEDCSDDEDFDKKEVDFDSSEEDYAGGSKFFTLQCLQLHLSLLSPLQIPSQPLLPAPYVLLLLKLLPQHYIDSIFHSLGPQGGTLVVDCSEVYLPPDCAPNTKQVEAELVSENGAVAPNSGGWEIVQSRKVRRKPSPPRTSTRSPHVKPCPTQGTSHMVHRER
ncbi:hypothetical protein Peur_004605 [Populus x canadensis]